MAASSVPPLAEKSLMQAADIEAPVKKRLGRPKNSSGDNAATLLRIALDLFSEQNYSSVTVKDIARAAGVNAALVHYYFASKEDLFLKVVEAAANEAFESFEAIRNNTVAPREVISLWIENHILQFSLMQKLIKISLDYATIHDRSERIDNAIRKFYDIEEEVLGNALRRGISESVFKPCDVNAMITFISTFLDGALIRSVMFRDKFDQRAAIRNLCDVTLRYLEAK
jgi:AcrR family transcriptional regulator